MRRGVHQVVVSKGPNCSLGAICAPIFRRMALTWTFTVASEISISRVIVLFEAPLGAVTDLTRSFGHTLPLIGGSSAVWAARGHSPLSWRGRGTSVSLSNYQ